jgi:hypothetical protein
MKKANVVGYEVSALKDKNFDENIVKRTSVKIMKIREIMAKYKISIDGKVLSSENIELDANDLKALEIIHGRAYRSSKIETKNALSKYLVSVIKNICGDIIVSNYEGKEKKLSYSYNKDILTSYLNIYKKYDDSLGKIRPSFLDICGIQSNSDKTDVFILQ